MKKIDFDNADLAIVGLTVIAVSALFLMNEPMELITMIAVGIAGIAGHKYISKKNGE